MNINYVKFRNRESQLLPFPINFFILSITHYLYFITDNFSKRILNHVISYQQKCIAIAEEYDQEAQDILSIKTKADAYYHAARFFYEHQVNELISEVVY